MSFEDLKSELYKQQTLNDLFNLWRKAHNEEIDNDDKTYIDYKTYHKGEVYLPIEKNTIIADGYISEEDYCNSKIKVLFVLREANIVMHRKDEIQKPNERTQKGFYFNYINDLKSNRPKQQEKMARMSFYLQHPELLEENRRTPNAEELKIALKSSGYMNINKRGGGNFVDWKIFDNYYNKYKEFIEKQINIMNPDYIVLIGNNNYEIFGDAIKIWHTSYRMKGKKRIGTQYGSSKNVDCYMREFFNRVQNHLNINVIT
ncbi:MAG: hypothetical protein MJ081_04370 [Ruminococcus sp.]|nr:hypothetical protein [Ruminococcus sp.]